MLKKKRKKRIGGGGVGWMLYERGHTSRPPLPRPAVWFAEEKARRHHRKDRHCRLLQRPARGRIDAANGSGQAGKHAVSGVEARQRRYRPSHLVGSVGG